MAKSYSQKQITYLRINSDGYLYVSSKTPRDGFKEVVLKDGSKTYQKLFNETEDGRISRIAIKEMEFSNVKVKYLSISVENDTAIDVIDLPFYTANKDLSGVVKGFIALMPNLDYSHTFSIGSNRNKSENGYIPKRLIIKDITTASFVKSKHRYGENGDIPAPIKKQKAGGDITYDYTDQDNYLYAIFEKELERFNKEKGNQNEGSGEWRGTNKVEEGVHQSANIQIDDDGDELPF